jgi:isoleucyl-tRNA synthetase
MDYKETLNLPKTDFPMKANLAQREPEILARWEAEQLYERLLEKTKGRPLYVLHDGPPYANGHIHIGTALNKILKDFVVKSKTMGGKTSPFVPGWDCHGLPIEHQVMKSLGHKKQEMSKLEIRKLCREYAEKYFKIQREEFKRLGVLGDWEHPYLTMTPDYEAAIVREFGKVVKTGGVYKGKKPVLWCPNDETALAEAEVEYEEDTSPSIYVKFRIIGAFHEGSKISDLLGNFILVWTTTPWTLPANQAVAVHPTEKYLRIEVKWKQNTENWILAEKLYKTCMEKFGLDEKDYRVIGNSFAGNELNAFYEHPFFENSSKHVVTAAFVTMDQGTGCVHIAPGHGQEDYELSIKYPKFDLRVFAPVDDQGRFTDEVGVPGLSGKNVFKANTDIIQLLEERGAFVHREALVHAYPHCWRCKNPVIFRATEQWFISMEKGQLRQRSIDEINRVDWIPKWGRDRIYGMIENRPDWCISRQRVWGVPIVAFTCLDCKEPLFSQEIVNHVADRIEREGGSDIWFSKPADELLPKGTACPKCKGNRFQKENDILDVWFESGVSHAAVLKTRPELAWPADLYLEGSDQHRGWFHSSLLTAVSTDGRAPYKTVLTHGFVVDGTGKKMSKSAGNVVAPQEVISQNGAEILRLWVAATDFREDVRISPQILSQLIEAYRKIRNTCRFLLGNLYDYDPKTHQIDDDELHEIDRWALHRLQVLIQRVRQGYDDFEFHVVFHAINNFCAVDLSALYLDILKDRLYTSKANSTGRRAAQRVLHQILLALTQLMAPVLSYTADELWRYLPRAGEAAPDIPFTVFPVNEERYRDEALAARWEKLILVREETAKALEAARNRKMIRASLDARVTIFAEGDLLEFLKSYEKDLAIILIVSEVRLEPYANLLDPGKAFVSQKVEKLGIVVEHASGEKCERCWAYRDTVGRSKKNPELCHRCAEAVET